MDGSILSVGGRAVIPDITWGQWFGDIAAVIPESESESLYLQWNGEIIPPKLFREILGFFKWSHDKYHCEAQLRLYYRVTDKQWKAVVMPQFIISGSSSTENDADDDFDTIKSELSKDGFGHVGSAHHHCSMGAFQSTVDYKDEIVTEGFHYTIGDLDDLDASFHGRCVVRKICYEADIAGFVPYIDNGILSLKNLPEPPEEWKGRMTKKKKVEYKGYKGHGFSGFNFGYWTPKVNVASVSESLKTKLLGGAKSPSAATTYHPDTYADDWFPSDEFSETSSYGLDETELGAEIVSILIEDAADTWGLDLEARTQFEDVIQQLNWALNISEIDPAVFQALADYTESHQAAIMDLYTEQELNQGGLQ